MTGPISNLIGKMLAAAIVVGFLTPQQSTAYTIPGYDPLVPPGVGAGETFQLVFVTSTKVSPDSLDGTADGVDNTTVADWNNHVNGIAGASTLAGIPDLTWHAIVSVDDPNDGNPGTAAIDNAVVAAPVYRIDGTLVATGSADFWDSSLAAPIKWNENGAEQDTNGGSGSGRLVWTGSRGDGTIGARPLGNPTSHIDNFSIRTGNAEATSDDWINTSDATRRGPTTVLRVYALSEVITVATVSEMLLVETSPADEAAGVFVPSVLTATFNEPVVLDTGNITLRNLTDSSDTVIPVGDPRLTVSGYTLTIDPGSALQWNKSYAVQIDPSAIDSDTGNSFAGISDDTTWNFTTNAADPVELSLQSLQDHINGAAPLTAAEIEVQRTTIIDGKDRLDDEVSIIEDAIATVEAYENTNGALTISFDRNNPVPDVNSVSDQLDWTIFNLMQGIMDVIYTSQNLADHETLLDGFKFQCSSHFPGAAAPPADPGNVHTALISGTFDDTFGRDTQQWGLPARKPTGCYLAPGTVVTVTVPTALVGQGYQVRVGAHSWDHEERNRPPIRRLSRATIAYDITTTSTKVASPYGGGIYIEVPIGSSAGVVSVDVTGAIRAPYFSAKSFHATTLNEWLTTERNHPAPWADFQSDKYMMQVPRTWIYALDDPVTLMAEWDLAMDAMNDLMGFPRLRGKETMYCQVDVILRSSVHAPGYPAVNQTDGNPTADTRGGYGGSYLVRGPRSGAQTEIHEQGHAYFFPKFGGETESAVNFPYVTVLHRALGAGLDQAHSQSRGMNFIRTLDGTAIAWMCSFNFSPRKVEMASAEKAYQLKGHAKFCDIVRLFGWEGLDQFWYSMNLDGENGDPVPSSNDAKLIRLCESVGQDVRPILHFWGIFPSDPVAVQAAVDAASLTPSPEIFRLLNHYKSIVPANNSEFRTFAWHWWGEREPNINAYWTETEHARQWDTRIRREGDGGIRTDITVGEMYVEACAAQVRDRVQEIIDLYFPLGDPDPAHNPVPSPDAMQFTQAPQGKFAGSVSMTAVAATGLHGPFEYYFENTTNGNNSGWIGANTWNNLGLTPGANYSFRVKARNSLLNETGWSAEESAIAGAAALPAAPPALGYTAMVDDKNGGPSTRLDPITYTVTFSQDMDAATVDASDFANDGSSSITVGTITETSPGVFTVEVTPTTTGTVRLKIPAGSALADAVGTAMDTTGDAKDDTILAIEGISITVPDVAGQPQATAEADIVAAGLSVGTVTSQIDAVVPAGDVISQSPVGGSTATEGNAVDLVVSLGPPDLTEPAIDSLDPADDTTNAYALTNLTATFDEDIEAGTGNITIKNLTDGTQLQIDITDGNQVTISGPALVIDPTANLVAGKQHAVRIDAGAITDLAGNSFAGISDDTTWNFTTRLTALAPDDPLVPAGVGPGETFQFVFVTSTKISADSVDGTADGVDNTTVAHWNSHVNGIASASTLSGIPGLNWYAIVSVDDPNDGSPGIAALDNAVVGAPVYRTDGTLVANGFADFWDSSLAAPIKWNENGIEQNTQGGSASGRQVWSGSKGDGSIDARPLGNPTSHIGNYSIRMGSADATGDDWINTSDSTRRSPTATGRVYALSEIITVVGGGSNTLADWISGYDVGGLTGIDDDYDGDGNSNGIENYFGTDPSAPSPGLAAGEVTEGTNTTFTFTHPLNDSPASDITVGYIWSKDMVNFHANGTADPAGTTVSCSVGAPSDGIVEVTATVTGTATDKVFVSVEVTQN